MSDERIAAYTAALQFAERQVAATIEHHPDSATTDALTAMLEALRQDR